MATGEVPRGDEGEAATNDGEDGEGGDVTTMMTEGFEAMADLLLPFIIAHPAQEKDVHFKMVLGALSWAKTSNLPKDATLKDKFESYIDHLKDHFKEEIEWKPAPSVNPPTPSQG